MVWCQGKFLVFPHDLLCSCVGHHLWKYQGYLGIVTAPANTVGQGPKWNHLCCIAPWCSDTTWYQKLAKPSSRGMSREWAQSGPSSDCNQNLLDKSVKLKIFLAVSIGRGKDAFCSFNEFIIQRPEVTKITDWLIRHNSRAIELHKGHYVGILIKHLSSALIRRGNTSREIAG